MVVTRKQRADRWSVLVAAVILVCFYAVMSTQMYGVAYRNDYLSFYSGAALAFDPALYDIARETAEQQSLLPEPGRPLVPFVRPVWYAWALRPLSWLPLDRAFLVWLGFQYALLAWCWWRAWRRFGDLALLLCVLYWPTQIGIANGQDCALMLFLVLESFLALEKERWTRAGVLLALTLVKWHLLVLVPVALVLNRQWRVFRAWLCTAAALAAMFALSGHLPSYFSLLTRKDLDRLAPSPHMMVNVQAIGINLGVPWLWVPLAIAVAAFAVWAMRGADLWRWFAIAITASVILPPHVYEYDAAPLLVAILCAVTAAPAPFPRIVGFLAALPLAYMSTYAGRPWSLSPSLLLFVFFLSLAWRSRETAAVTGAAGSAARVPAELLPRVESLTRPSPLEADGTLP